MYEIQLNKCLLNACRAGDAGSIPGWGTKIPGAIGDTAAIF